MILTTTDNMYNRYDFINNYQDSNIVKNRLFATFTTLENIDELIGNVTNNYQVLFNKIFILKVLSNDEYVCTYNVESGNIKGILDNTILVHRKKESNSLYTINALNELIKTLNNGKIDNNFLINWNDYRNTIILTQKGEVKQLKTKVFKIVNL